MPRTHFRLLVAFLFFSVCPLATWANRGGDDAVYVYDLFQGAPDCAALAGRLKQLPLRPTVILSIEQGIEFLLDRPNGEALLVCALKHLRGARPGHRVKALLLQDASFLDENSEAMRRVDLLAKVAARNKGLLAGAQIDVEPYVVEKWGCCPTEERRALMRSLHRLLGEARRALRPLPLGVVAPWWYPAVGSEIPEAAPEALYAVADEIYLMAYGDEGGPLVGGDAGRVLDRVDAPAFIAGRGRMHVAFATYEYQSPEHLRAEIEAVRHRLSKRPTFAGTAIFHAASKYNVPLARFVTGIVTDADGGGVAGVEVEAAGIRGQASSCGQFTLRGLPAESATLVLKKPGFRARSMAVQPPAPGAVLDLGKIILEKE